jgi:hypothetical protein
LGVGVLRRVRHAPLLTTWRDQRSPTRSQGRPLHIPTRFVGEGRLRVRLPLAVPTPRRPPPGPQSRRRSRQRASARPRMRRSVGYASSQRRCSPDRVKASASWSS